MTKVRFNDLQLSNIELRKQFHTVLDTVLDKGSFILGNEVRAFETEFAHYIGVKYAVGVASGTDALMLSLLAFGLQPKDEVAIPVNVYPVVFAVVSAGFHVVLVDVDPETHNMDPRDLRRKVTKNTKAVILVHLYGKAALVQEIMTVAREKKLRVVEDCSQAHGAQLEGRRVGVFGEISCFSLYPTKNLGALGDGGVILTDKKRVADKLRALRQYGEVKRYMSTTLGRISRLDELQAAFLRVKLRLLDGEIKKRIQNAQHFQRLLKDVPEVVVPSSNAPHDHVYHLFVIQARKRNALKVFLEQYGIETGVHYPHLIHNVRTFSYLPYTNADFPNAMRSNRHILSLPFSPHMQIAEIKFVCKMIKKFYS